MTAQLHALKYSTSPDPAGGLSNALAHDGWLMQETPFHACPVLLRPCSKLVTSCSWGIQHQSCFWQVLHSGVANRSKWVNSRRGVRRPKPAHTKSLKILARHRTRWRTFGSMRSTRHRFCCFDIIWCCRTWVHDPYLVSRKVTISAPLKGLWSAKNLGECYCG